MVMKKVLVKIDPEVSLQSDESLVSSGNLLE